MKINNYSLIKAIKTIAIIIALTISTNVNATSATTSPISSSIHVTSTNLYAMTWGSGGFWDFIKKIIQHVCSKCGSQSCSGSCGGGGQQGGGGTSSIPLDGGLGILALGAAAIGIKKLRGKKNDKF
jgi:hypothetical protein